MQCGVWCVVCSVEDSGCGVDQRVDVAGDLRDPRRPPEAAFGRVIAVNVGRVWS